MDAKFEGREVLLRTELRVFNDRFSVDQGALRSEAMALLNAMVAGGRTRRV